ncbi:hypothetical protein ABH897_001526 [Paenibacillus sp. RC73]|uniref:hypothetical protein n=1 Tax=unclassified Paenibacillus TaxID=185978 RepID=UPI0024B96FA9|nr:MULTISPECIES: hypothetical protein [unclassified Paenibacillus]
MGEYTIYFTDSMCTSTDGSVIFEAQHVKEKATITEESLRQLLSGIQDHISSRNLSEIKKFIDSYVEKLIVYQEHVEVIFKLQVVDLYDRGEGEWIPLSEDNDT